MFKGCPSREKLVVFALKPTSSRIAKHVADCDGCRRALDELCMNEELLAELRHARATGVDDRLRERLVTLCQRVKTEDDHRPRRTHAESVGKHVSSNEEPPA